MKNTVLALLAVMLFSSCSKERAPQQIYDNPKIGLRMTYPRSWRVMKQEDVDDAIAQSEEKTLTLPPESFDAYRETVPYIVLSLMKPHKINGADHNPNINVGVFEIPEDQRDDVDVDSIMQEQIADLESLSSPPPKVTINDFPLPDYPNVHNYSVRVRLPGRVATVYQYAYWHAPFFVQIGFTFSHPDVEQEVKAIITTMKIKTSNKTPRRTRKDRPAELKR